MTTRIQLRRGTAAQWTSANPTLASGEVGLETDTGKRKIGNGADNWAALPYDLTKLVADGLYPDKSTTDAHIASTSNPHSVTKGQVGLGNADNTSDADKPVSTAVASALALKADKATAITAGAGLTGGGDLSTSRSLALSSATQTSLGKADTALQAADIASFETTTQLNSRDAANRNRSNHTGTQLAATISDLAATVSANADVAANTSARHTHANKATLDNVTAAYTTAEASKLAGIATGADVTAAGNVGSVVAGVTAKTTPVDADTLPLTDSAASNALKKLSWANLKATVKAYTDTLYSAIVHTHAQADITNLVSDLASKAADSAVVKLTGDQTISGTKTFQPSDYQPAFGANLAPALASWALTGTATYSAPNIVITSGAGSMSANIAVTSGTLYQIEVTASPSSGGDLTISLGAATDTCTSTQRAVALVAPSTGTLTITISGATWAATITAIVVRAVTRAAASLVAGAGEVRAWGTHTAVGAYAQRSLTTGSNDTAVGASAQQNLTTGNYDTAVGMNAQYSLTTGSYDTAVGMNAQRYLTTGSYDTAVGAAVQEGLTTGSSDTAVGTYAQQNLTTGSSDTAVGAYAQRSLTTGSNDTAVGASAQRSLTTGSSDTAVGANALYAPNGNTSNATTTASNQTAIGYQSGQSSATQVDGITVVGYRALAGATNATALGYQARADHSGGVALGDNSTTTAANQVEIAGRHIEFVEMSEPAAGAADSARLFVKDNGSGKTQLCVRFATGAVQVIATEP